MEAEEARGLGEEESGEAGCVLHYDDAAARAGYAPMHVSTLSHTRARMPPESTREATYRFCAFHEQDPRPPRSSAPADTSRGRTE